MGNLLAIMSGVVCGIAAATPLLLQLRRADPDFGRGFGAVIGAFLVIQLCMFAVHAWWPGMVAPFGVSATLAYLACVVVAVLRRGVS